MSEKPIEKLTTAQERQKSLGAATTAANKRLKEAHLEEWNKLMAEEAKARGVEWKRRESPEEKAEKELTKLIEQFPHLAEKIKAEGVSAVI